MKQYDIIIVGTGPTGLGAAFSLIRRNPALSVLLIDREPYSVGGLRNDCKMNFTYPIGFPADCWDRGTAEHYLEEVRRYLEPDILEKAHIETYKRRSERLDVEFVEIEQTHLGTDGGLELIKKLIADLESLGVEIRLQEEMIDISEESHTITTDSGVIGFGKILIAPGRHGFKFLQRMMDMIDVPYIDHIVDVGVRVETRQSHYPIVQDVYDPKFIFPDKVRTFCTNSGNAHVVQERYTSVHGLDYYSVNGHAYSTKRKGNGLVNFAMLKTIRLTEPLASGQDFAEGLGLQAMLLGGGHPIMQRVGDFRLGKRSKRESFNDDLYDFAPTLSGCTPGDISLSVPAKVLRGIWKSLKLLDTIVPGVLHPSTVLYYPEIKLYANKPTFLDNYFRVSDDVFMAGDGAGTSRGITAAWASGVRAADGILL